MLLEASTRRGEDNRYLLQDLTPTREPSSSFSSTAAPPPHSPQFWSDEDRRNISAELADALLLGKGEATLELSFQKSRDEPSNLQPGFFSCLIRTDGGDDDDEVSPRKRVVLFKQRKLQPRRSRDFSWVDEVGLGEDHPYLPTDDESL